MGDGNAESGAMKDLGKPCAGEPHARFDERGLETEYGLGTAAPATRTRGQRRTYRPPRQPPTLPRPGAVNSAIVTKTRAPDSSALRVTALTFKGKSN